MFSSIAAWLKKAFSAPIVKEAVMTLALPLVEEAALKHITSDNKREWVVKALMAHRVPESTARIAVELAYQQLQAQLAKIIPPPTTPKTVV